MWDVLVGIASSGVHSNGFSLVRSIVERKGFGYRQRVGDCDEEFADAYGDRTLGDVLLTPTRIYIKPMLDVIRQCDVHGVCHITGGGFDENIPRVLHEGQGLEIKEGTWKILPVFQMLEKWGKIPHREMFNIFNMGIGMVVVMPENEAVRAMEILKSHGEEASVIGRVTGTPGVNII